MSFKIKKNRIVLSLLMLAALAAPAAGQTTQSAQTPATADPAAACACEASPLPEVLATVNGARVTRQDISPSVQKRIAELQQQVVEARRRELDLQINSVLLEAEAKRRGVSTVKLLEAEVVSKVQEPTEADAQKFYEENRARIDGDFAKTKEQIVDYLREVAERKAQTDFAARMRAGAEVRTFLNAPAAPVYKIATDGQPSKGNPAAAVTLVEFTDYQCPSCAVAQPIIQRVIAEYGDRVRLVVRDYPLPQHADALKAAEAAEAAREQDKYWEYTMLLYQNQSALQVEKLKEYASRVGLDRAKFDAALDSGRYADSVHRDLQDGERVGVGGTPTIYVNGVRVERATYELLKTAIDAALKTARTE